MAHSKMTVQARTRTEESSDLVKQPFFARKRICSNNDMECPTVKCLNCKVTENLIFFSFFFVRNDHISFKFPTQQTKISGDIWCRLYPNKPWSWAN